MPGYDLLTRGFTGLVSGEKAVPVVFILGVAAHRRRMSQQPSQYGLPPLACLQSSSGTLIAHELGR